jgi:linoleoyl-CoA desaturase
MHDALHGSYSKKAPVNKLLGYSIYFLGANAVVWKVHHNVLHHTYTNIHGLDEDIDNKAIIRLSHEAPLKWIHRYQHMYAFLLYGFLTMLLFFSDFIKMVKFYRLGAVKERNLGVDKEFLKLIGLKVLYLFFMLALPLLVTALLWWQVVLGFVLMHLTAGYILSIIFQMAHIVEGAHQPMPNEAGEIENAWAIHQLQTTANFARKSRILNWYIGGLNHQIEHHLFPNICHVHYRKISAIVEKTAEEFHLPYNVKPTFMNALFSHIRILKTLGRLPGNQSIA